MNLTHLNYYEKISVNELVNDKPVGTPKDYRNKEIIKVIDTDRWFEWLGGEYNEWYEVNDGDKGLGFLKLASEVALTVTAANTYQKIEGTYIDTTNLLENFEVTTDGVLKYTGHRKSFVLHGTSNLKADQACEATYGFFVNGSLYPGAETPMTFLSSARIINISITAVVTLETNDLIEIYMKSDTINDSFTIKSLSVVLSR